MRLLLVLALMSLLIGASSLPGEVLANPSPPAPGLASAAQDEAGPSGGAEERVHRVSLVALLANPRQFDDQLVMVSGFLHLEYEGDALYLSKDDFDAFLTKNAVWVDGPKFEELAARRSLSGRYVTVTGRFDADRGGHLGTYAASLESASHIRVVPSRWELAVITRPDFYTLNLPWALNLPWPAIIAGLWAWAALLFVAWRRESTSSGRATRVLLAFAIVLTVFSAARLQGAVLGAWAMIGGQFWWGRDPFMVAMAVELVTSLAGPVVLWVAFRRKQSGLLLGACVLILIPPTVIEAMRFDGLSPVHSGVGWSRDVEWRRTRPASDGSTGYPDRIEF